MKPIEFRIMTQIWLPFIVAIALCGCANTQDTVSVTNTEGVEMVFVPAGEFLRGTDITTLIQLCRDTHSDQYVSDCSEATFADLLQVTEPETVFVDGFYMDRYEVSIASYIRCIEADVCDPFSIENIYYSYIENNDIPTDIPVTGVNYYDASIYCAWRGGRLPTVIEWEYAASGPDNRQFPWGDWTTEIPTNYCDSNCSLLYSVAYDDGFRETAPVTSFEDGQSWAGIYNLSGNVSEWTSTRSHDGAGTVHGTRLTKGGSYHSPIFALSIWLSIPAAEGDELATNGFRCVRTTEP